MVGLLVIGAGCSNNSNPVSSNVTMKMSTVSTTGQTSSSGRLASSGRSMATTSLTDFKVNIGKVEFDVDSEDPRFATDSVYDDAKLVGPFLIDLLDSAKTLNQVIASVSVPNATYDEVGFNFVNSTEAGVMNGKSLYVAGYIDGKKFVIWSDHEFELKVDFADATKNFSANGASALLNIKVQIDALMAELINLANQNLLADSNGNGVIELTTTDADGNKSLGESLLQLLDSETHLDDKD